MPDETTMERRQALLREIQDEVNKCRAGNYIVIPDDNRWSPISLTAAGLSVLLGFLLGLMAGLEIARLWGAAHAG